MNQEWRLLACAALETALASVKAQAPEEYARLRQLHGKVFCIQLSQLSWPIYLVFAGEILVLSQYQGEIAIKLNADATSLYRLSEGAELTDLIKQDKLAIEGDLGLLQSFSQYLQQIRFDFAEPLSRYLGDAPTHMLLSGLKRARTGMTHLISQSRAHLGQLTTEEYRLAPHKLEFIHFCDRLDELNTEVTALERRLAQLRDTFTS
ncbi:SCP2 sterol-binding domain-containing protein [Shewanella sp. AS16]|uniref:ubiquinone biosynthesis accessory factor UbiJ n=1 Tax=Shewanella sp. AS16 TaxID=2907625 RepID=UPI001F162EB5|nr:SCP2 sterol-binding domain-containing protein [Shewanella sp. AS16]MCE9685944.1 SCP2 sterol-binding domain-containing protein [Shewanella sp. AS16]